MKSTLLTVMLLFLMPRDSESGTYPLDMMEASVDDMYDGCKEKMTDEEMNYLKCDMKNNDKFKNGWEKAEDFANDKKSNSILTKNQIQAVHLYTTNEVYDEFNKAVRDGSAQYTSNTFKFYAFHFWLTSAIQVLKAAEKEKCHTTYRGTKASFEGKEGKDMRFGSFASSSKKSDVIKSFGTETCFHITTCMGAFIKDYSAHKSEEEVLIPPYEIFKIIKKESGSTTTVAGLEVCKTIFVLKSTEKSISYLNCKAPETRTSESKLKSLCCGCLGSL